MGESTKWMVERFASNVDTPTLAQDAHTVHHEKSFRNLNDV